MNDCKDPIERELEKALAVDPSPDLQARIRRRVGELSVRSKRPFWLAPALGLAAAAAIAIAVITLRTVEPPPTPITLRNREPVAVQTVTSHVTEIQAGKVSGKDTERGGPREVRQSEAAALLRKAAAIPRVIVTAPTTVIPSAEPLELKPLLKLELKTAPLPDTSISPMAKFETFSIEPFNFVANTTGVNE